MAAAASVISAGRARGPCEVRQREPAAAEPRTPATSENQDGRYCLVNRIHDIDLLHRVYANGSYAREACT